MLNSVEFKYIADFILGVAFPNIKFMNKDNVFIYNNYKIHFYLMDDEQVNKLVYSKLEMDFINTYDNEFKIPIYNLKSKFLTIKNNNIYINADILTLPFLLLSRKEEILINKNDELNRFMFDFSLSKKYNLIDFPIIDEYAYILRKNLCEILNIEKKNKSGKIILSHDIDTFSRFGNLYKNFKTIIGGDLISRKKINYFFESINELILTKKDGMNDPKIKSIIEFLDLSKKYDLDAHFFFLAYDKKDKDFRYSLNDYRIKKIINMIIKNNKKVGLHIGLNASDDENEFSKQLNRLKKISNIQETRTHYLKFDFKKTISIYEKYNIKYDYSLGYHEKSGFKCGTCHEFKLFDLVNNKVTKIIERPLVVMDGSLKDEEALTIDEALFRLKKLYKNCMRVDGNFILLWHPDSTIREWKQWYNKVYKKFLEEVA